jgi:hypothetical protein
MLKPILEFLLQQLTLIQPGEVKVDLANFDVEFRAKFLYNVLFFIWPIPAEMSSKSFWTSDMTSKNDVLTSILTFFRQNFCRVATLSPSPLPTGFTPITDQPSAGEVPPGRGPQCGAAPVKFRSVSCPGLRRVRGEAVSAGSQSGHILMLPHRSGQIPETAALYTYAPNTGRGEFTPRESEVKTERTPVGYGQFRPRLI